MYKNHKTCSEVMNYLICCPLLWTGNWDFRLLLVLWNPNENWSSSFVASFFSTGVTNYVWTTDCLLTPFFSRGIYFMRKGKKVNWKLIPMCLINGHWRMHSNLCTAQLFHFKPHTGNYSLPSLWVNVFVAPSPPLMPVVLFSVISKTM